jgi:hypothetical protein
MKSRHEVDEVVPFAVLEVKLGGHDVGILKIALLRFVIIRLRQDAPYPGLFLVEQRSEYGLGIEARQARPDDSSLSVEQRRALAVADQRVIKLSQAPTP